MKIDHIVLATGALQQTSEELEALSGVKPNYGGKHGDGQPENTLLSLGERQYLEILGTQPGADPNEDWVAFCLNSPKPRILTICFSPDIDMPALADRAKEIGLTDTDLVAGSRVRPDGVELSWQLCLPQHSALGFRFPFFIDWAGSAHPSQTAPTGLTLKAVSLTHPNPGELETVSEHLHLPIALKQGSEVFFQADLEGPKGAFTLT